MQPTAELFIAYGLSKKNSGYYSQLVHVRVSTGRKLDYARVVKQSTDARQSER